MTGLVKKLAVVAIIVGIIITYVASGAGDWLSFEDLQQQSNAWRAWHRAEPLSSITMFGLLYIVVAALSLPIATLLGLAAGMMFGVITGSLVVSFASTIGATFAFLSSRYVLRDAIQQRLGERLGTINDGLEHDGAYYLFSLRLIPAFPFWFVNIAMGITTIRVSTFYWVSQIGMLPGTIVFVNAGTQLGTLSSPADIFSPGLIAAFIIFGLFPLVAKWFMTKIRPPRPDTDSENTATTSEIPARKSRWIMIGMACLLALMMTGWWLFAPGRAPAIPHSPTAGQIITTTNRSAYQRVLEQVVNDQGLVDYSALVADPSELISWYASVAHLDQSSFASWSRDEQLAFWINVYNGLTLLLVIEHYPISRSAFGLAQNLLLDAEVPADSLRNVPWLWQGITFQVMGQSFTLDHIEHQIIRPQFQEPRIHFAINCAAISCPALRREPYTGAQLNHQLDDQTQRYLATSSSTTVIIDQEHQRVVIPQLLAMFAEDFASGELPTDQFLSGDTAAQRHILAYVAAWLSAEQADFLRHEKYSLSFAPYNWGLNQQ